MATRISLCLLFLFLTWGFTSYSQKPVVKISIENKIVDGNIPFDEEFLIKGAADKNLLSVSFKYRVKNGIKSNQYWPEVRDSEGYSTPSTWIRDGDEYYVNCGRLHPNVTYEFHFTIKKKVVVDEVKRKEINQAIIDHLKVFFAPNDIDSRDLTNLRTTLTDIIKNKLNLQGKLVDASGNEFTIGPFTPPLSTHVLKISDLVSQIDADSTVVAVTFGQLEILKPTVMDPIENVLADIYSGRIRLGSTATDLLKRPVDPSNKEFGTVDGHDFMALFAKELSNENDVTKLLNGTVKIEGKRLVRAEEKHLASIELLAAFVRLLQNQFFTLEQSAKAQQERRAPAHVFSTARRTILNTIQRQLEMYTGGILAVIKNKKELDVEVNRFPDLMVNTFVETEFQVFEQPTIEVTNDRNPYVGLDVGIVVAPGIESAFTYWGLNCYLVPVNKSAPLNIYQKKDKFLKKFSIYLGFTQNITSKNYERYEDLFNNKGSLLVGCGWRFTRALRGNFGGLLYLQKDKNPVVDDTNLAITPTLSLSLDINIAKAFGELTKVFIQ